jgi:putative ABC transport system permease protein
MSDFKFLLKTAYADSRKNWTKLAMFMSSIVLGMTALVAINSFNYNLIRDIDKQSKSLIGADIQVSGNQVLPESLETILDSLGGEKASQMELFSMALIPSTEATQFVRIRAIEGGFPFYGQLSTEPESARVAYQEDNGALVDEGLMFENNLSIGDSIKLGEQLIPISGKLLSTFGSVSLGSSFAPSVYINRATMDKTNLVQPGSIVEYNYYRKLDESIDAEEWEESEGRQRKFRDLSFRMTTVEDNRRRLDRAFSSLNSFLNLVALVSLILGCIGVASSVLIYIRSKIPSIAIMRCLGMKGKQAFGIFFAQIFIIGLIAVLIGVALGSLLQIALPIVLKDVLPYEVDLQISWKAIIQGFLIGIVITSLFAVIPLLSIRKISPLRTLRASYDEDQESRDPLKYLLYAVLLICLVVFLYSLTTKWLTAFAFTIGLLISFGLLYGLATVTMWVAKKFFPRRWSFVLRQGISNLYRPNNQTKTLIVSIGLGTAILTILYIIQGLILSNVDSMDAGNQPNTVLYGIESGQVAEVSRITEEYDMPVIQEVPIVTMRLAGWQGKSKAEWLRDTTRRASRWAINREARVSYRDTLNFDEELIRGDFVGQSSPGDSIFISLDEGYAESLNVDIGDEMEWNIQGTVLKTYISSIRKIEFRSMRTRFFILFPRGVLEEAPQFHVLITKSPDNEVLGSYRRDIVKAFPNISVVDLGSILTTLNDIISKISYVIKFMAGFSILTGLIVLLSSLLLSKYQRIRESVLLRTIGALRSHILAINATEYAILGSLSAAIGIIISIVGSYLLATRELDLEFNLNWWPIITIFFFVTGATVAIGLWNNRDVVSKSPLEVLRKDV